MEREHLAQADLHIAEGEQRALDLEKRLDNARAAGADLTEGERLLNNIRNTLEEMRIHRQLIIEAIARNDAQH